MAAVVFSFLLAFVAASLTWLVLGSRFKFDTEERANDILNLGVYVAVFAAPAFALAFFVLND